MHAFLIIGDNEAVGVEINRFASKKGTKPLEFSIDKIEKTRELTNFLKLSQPESTLIVVRDVDNATPESLNAFLKNLEEPNANVTFLLTASNEFRVLPTILSRCQIIRLKTAPKSVKKDDMTEAEIFLKSTVGDKLRILDKIKKREEATVFLEKLLLYVNASLFDANAKYIRSADILTVIQQTLDAIGQNGNVTMQLTNMLVKIEKTDSISERKKV